MKRMLLRYFLSAIAFCFFTCVLLLKDDPKASYSISELIRLENSNVAGTILDKNGQVIASGSDYHEFQFEGDDRSISNIFGLEVSRTMSSYYLRTQSAKYLYGAGQNNFTVKNLLTRERKRGSVQLSINKERQDDIYQIFENADVTSAACVVLNYETGAIEAMVSYPSFRLSNVSEWPLSEDGKLDEAANHSAGMNKAVRAINMPASTIKAILYAITVDTHQEYGGYTYECTGSIAVEGQTFSCPQAHGLETQSQALENSCNCYTISLLSNITKEELHAGLKRLGFYDKAEENAKIEIPFSKRMGFEWGSFSSSQNDMIAYLAQYLGEGNLKVSPLHLASIYSAFFNEGQMVSPYVIQSAKYSEESEMNTVGQTESVQIFAPVVAEHIRNCLLNAVNLGTGSLMNINNIIAGKTGTGDLQSNNVIWAVGGSVEANTPYLAVVMVDEVNNPSYTGGSFASPLLREILSLYVE